MPVKHSFVSGIADDPTAAAGGEVLPSHWNADHDVTVAVSEITATGTADATTFLRGDGTWQTTPVTSPAGSNTQLQFNNSGSFGASSSLTWDGVVLAAPRITLTPPDTASALTLTGGTVTTSQPLINATQTWNSSGTTFTGLKLNVTNTASHSSSLLADLQAGGVSRHAFYPNGGYTCTGDITAGRGISVSYGVTLGAAYPVSWGDAFVYRDAANTLAQRNGTNAQTFRVYNTYTDASNYEHGKLEWSSNVLRIGTEKAGTGTARALELQTDGTTRVTLGAAGGVTLAGGTAATATLSNVQVTGTGGQFSCDAASSTLAVGQVVTITGTNSGTATLNGYSSPSQYVISATNGSTTFTLQGVYYNPSAGLNRFYPVSNTFTSTAGTTTGLTFTIAPNPALTLTQTFNSSSADFTALVINAANTASASRSWLADFQTNGVSVARISTDGGLFSKSTKLWFGTATQTPSYTFNISDNLMCYTSSSLNIFEFNATGANTSKMVLDTKAGELRLDSAFAYRIGTDTSLTRKAAASFQLGAADAAAPVAQTLGVQSVVAGTSNTAGVNWTLRGSQGTGTGAGGSIILQVAPAGSSGTAQNALTTALTISAAKTITAGDAFDFAFGTTTGSKLGTATDQKLGFWNAAPVVQPANTDAIDTLLVTTGLRASGGTAKFATAVTTPSVAFPGSTSGTVTVQPAATAGTYSLTLPTSAGSSGQYLKTDGSGALSWDTPGAGSGSPGGADTYVQFNDGGALGGEAAFAYNKTSNTLSVDNAVVQTLSLSGNISAAAWTTSGLGIKVTSRTLTDTSSSGTVAAAYTNVLGGNTIAASNAGVTYTDYASLQLGTPTAGTNVTITNGWSLIAAGNIRAPSVSLGVAGSTLGSLKLSGNTSGTVTIQTAAAAGTYTLTLPVDDGTASQVLTTDGSGVLSWTTVGGGNATPLAATLLGAF